MATHIEDLEPDLNDLEYVWDLPGALDPNLSLLLSQLRANVLTEAVPHAELRAILWRAARPPLGVCVSDYLRRRDLLVTFRSLRNIVELDAALAPFYGNVIPAIDELQALGLTAAAKEMWLDAFQQRSPVNRVATVAQMLSWASLLLLGVSHPALGTPSRSARARRVVRREQPPIVDVSSAVVLRATWSLHATPTSQVHLPVTFTLQASGALS